MASNALPKRRLRQRRLRLANVAAGYCTRKRQGGGGPCGAPISKAGECAYCTRRERGICAWCDAPVDGRVGFAVYCAPHRADAFRRLRLAGSKRRHRRNAGSSDPRDRIRVHRLARAAS